MKRRFLILIIFLAIVAFPVLAQQVSPPLTNEQVMDLVKFGLDSAELAKRINERGIGFELSGDYVDALRNAGAQEVVVQALVARSAFAQESGPPLTKDQVTYLVKFVKDGAKVASGIRGRGIDFEPSNDYFETLHGAGVEDVVIKALREANPKPLTREQVGKLVAGGVPSQRAAALVEQHGVDFQPDAQYLDTMRLAGADDAMIDALRKASAAGMGEMVVNTSPNAQVYLDGVLQGKADTQGVLAIRAFRGSHAWSVSLEDTVGFEQRVRFIARQATNIEARLVGITAELLVATSPGADVYLDGALQGRADGMGEFTNHATFGTQSLRISKFGKKDYLTDVRVTSHETMVISAMLP